MVDHLQVHQFAHQNAIIVNDEENIAYAMELMTKFNIRHLPVVSKKLKLSGILTTWDIAKLIHEIADFSFLDININEVMTDAVISSYPATSLVDAILMMRYSEISGLPVVEDDDIVGIFTSKDSLTADVLWENLDGKEITPIEDIGDFELVRNPIEGDHSLWQVFDKMIDLKKRYVCVEAEDGEILQTVSLLQIFDEIIGHTYPRPQDLGYLHRMRVGDLYAMLPLKIKAPVRVGLIRKRMVQTKHEMAILFTHELKKVISEADLFQYLCNHLSEIYYSKAD